MSTYLTNLLAWSTQVGIVAAVGASLPRLFRINEARAKLWYWHIVLMLCLALPLLQPWARALPTASQITFTSGQFHLAETAQAAGFNVSWQVIGLMLLGAGIALRLLWLGFGLLRLRRYRNDAIAPAETFSDLRQDIAPEAEILVCAGVSSPVTFGLLNPVILLPDHFADLGLEDQRSIVCHELIHIRRRDWPVAIAEEMVRSILWFHPAFWWLLSQIQLTREQVVDEAVIEHTGDRNRYLDALLAIASLRLSADLASGLASDLAPAPLFLKKRHLRQRVESIVSGVTMTKRNLLLPLAAAFATLPIVIGIAAWQFPLRAAPQEASDDSGVEVQLGAAKILHRTGIAFPEDARAKHLSGTVVANVTVDDKGEVTAAQAVSGPDELRKPVLRSLSNWHFELDSPSDPRSFQIAVKFDDQIPTDVPRTIQSIDLGTLPAELRDKVSQSGVLHVGDVLTPENMKTAEASLRNIDDHLRLKAFIHGDKQDVLVSLATTPTAIRVGGNVQAANILTKVTPRYPPDAKQARVQGTVKLSVLIGMDGRVKNIELVSGDPMLVPSAMEAVSQWVYKPTLLNGNPVDVMTTVDINYTLSQ